jgi:alpha-L-fucosidase 2
MIKWIITALLVASQSLLAADVRTLVAGSDTLSAEMQDIDWTAFLKRQDMRWDTLPRDWLQAPYLGNGMLGLLIFQEGENVKNKYATNEKNVIAIHLGRGNYYDNRAPVNGNEFTWIYRGRLPIGFFRMRSLGEVKGVDWRLDLRNAELAGTITTQKGAYKIRAFVHSLYDTFSVEVSAEGAEQVSFEWQPQEAYSYPRHVCEASAERSKKAGNPITPFDQSFTGMPYPKAPEPQIVQGDAFNYCQQILDARSGDLVTGWKIRVAEGGKRTTLTGSIHFSQKMDESLVAVTKNLLRAEREQKSDLYVASHQKWWHDYYPLSYLSLSDPFWEQFYWIQMYRFASATRKNGMVIDEMGPWYQPGFWPMIWTDLNVQIAYRAYLTANRLDVGESLLNQIDKYAENLCRNVPKAWQPDCLNAGTIFPADMKAQVGKTVPDHLVWMLHNYWLHCQYADDQVRLKERLFPLLKKAVNTYFKYLQENPLDLKDGKIHVKSSWSPEYPGGTGVDINYTLGLLRWSCGVLLDISKAAQLNDPLEAEWQRVVDNLADYPVDGNGLRIGRDIAFEKSHRHYSHLLAFYPLFNLTPDTHRDLVKRSVDHWLNVAQDSSKIAEKAMSVTGYTCTGAASMYAALGDGETALLYLRKMPFVNVSSTTMYAEGNPAIEVPFSAATSIQEMLLQSWDDRIRIMPAIPSVWPDVQFRTLRCQGGALVSADRSQGKLMYVRIDSPDKRRKIVFSMEMADPVFSLIAIDRREKVVTLEQNANGFYQVTLEKGSALKVVSGTAPLKPFASMKAASGKDNIFGFNRLYDAVIKEMSPIQ